MDHEDGIERVPQCSKEELKDGFEKLLEFMKEGLMTLPSDQRNNSDFTQSILTLLPKRGNRFGDPALGHDTENTFMYIQRSKNANVACYEASYHREEQSAKAGSSSGMSSVSDLRLRHGHVSVYWQDIEPSYVEANRKKGKMDDKVGLNMIEKAVAYGVSVEKIGKKDADGAYPFGEGLLRVEFVAVPKRRMILCGLRQAESDSITPVLMAWIAGRIVIATKMFVQTTEPKHFYQLPKVDHIDLFGISVSDGKQVCERIFS